MQTVFAPASMDRSLAVSNQWSSGHYLSGGENRLDTDPEVSGYSAEKSESTPRALVVDDVPDVTEMLAVFLKHAGYEVATASSGPDALEIAHTERFDVVVSDIGMPGMDGYELAEALRALPDYRTVPLIAVTGFSLYDDRARAIKSGFNAHVTKPINPMALLELIQQLSG